MINNAETQQKEKEQQLWSVGLGHRHEPHKQQKVTHYS